MILHYNLKPERKRYQKRYQKIELVGFFGELLKYLHESSGRKMLLLSFNINILQNLQSGVEKVGGHPFPPLGTKDYQMWTLML